MVPVLSVNNKPLMPCSHARARLLMKNFDAKPYWQKGIFCIKMLRDVLDNKLQAIALGIDPGSKREGYTVITETNVVLNITTNTPDWVKDHITTRHKLRRTRRYRKTPYRACRKNRAILKKNRVVPSTKARWDAKLNMIKSLKKILPITIINVEDVCAISKKGNRQWSKSFSPLEVGKKYFYNEIEKLNIELILTKGYDTKIKRDQRGFSKSTKKLDYTWEAHNVDSHVLCEIALGKDIVPIKNMYKIEFLEYNRRQLHIQLPIKNGFRRLNGGTVSMGLSRGSVLRYKNKMYYLGGTMNEKLSIHDINTKKRISKYIKKEDIKILYRSNKRIQFLK